MLQNIILIRNIFYKLSFIGFLFYVFIAMFFIYDNIWAVNIIINTYNISGLEANFLIAYFMGWIKMIIVLFFLLPAFVLHWTGYSLKITNDESKEAFQNIQL